MFWSGSPLGHLRMLPDDPNGQADLVAEVDDPELALQPAELLDGPRQLDPLQRGSMGVGGLGRLQPLEVRSVEVHDLLGFHHVVLQLLVEREDVGHDGRLPPRREVIKGHPVQDPSHELRPLGRRDDSLAGFDPDQHAMAIEDLGGEPVVVEDLRLLALLQLEGA